MNDADAPPIPVAVRERPYVTSSRHLFTSAEDLVHCSRGHHAKLKSRKAPQAGVEAPDRKGQRRRGTRHSTNVSPEAGSPWGPGKGRPRSLFLSGFLRNREHLPHRGGLPNPQGNRLPALRAPVSQFHNAVSPRGLDGDRSQSLGSQSFLSPRSHRAHVRASPSLWNERIFYFRGNSSRVFPGKDGGRLLQVSQQGWPRCRYRSPQGMPPAEESLDGRTRCRRQSLPRRQRHAPVSGVTLVDKTGPKEPARLHPPEARKPSARAQR